MNDAIRTPTRMEIVERVSRLGPLFAKRTAEYDREARFPHENWEGPPRRRTPRHRRTRRGGRPGR